MIELMTALVFLLGLIVGALITYGIVMITARQRDAAFKNVFACAKGNCTQQCFECYSSEDERACIDDLF